MSNIDLKLNKKWKFFIFASLGGAVIVALLIQYFPVSKEQSEAFDQLLTAIGLSIFGILFMLLRRMRVKDYMIEPFELLLFLVYPSIATIPLLKEPQINLVLFFPIYFAMVIIWFLVAHNKIVKPIKNEIHQKMIRWYVLFMWGGLMSLSLPVFVILFGFVFPYIVNN